MKALTIFILALLFSAGNNQNDFLSNQRSYERVRTAFTEKGQLISETLINEHINPGTLNILIKVHKAEQQLEIYAKNKADISYKKIAEYKICYSSGELGPKRQQGDGQVPEGFYHIDRFNPTSSYYLSLGVSYPNLADKRKSKASNLGGDIFIHGECVTIGCIPMTNDKIKEIYLYAIQARQAGQIKIPVYIFPFRMTIENMNKYKAMHTDNQELCRFWDNLKSGYDLFEKRHTALRILVDNKGDYLY